MTFKFLHAKTFKCHKIAQKVNDLNFDPWLSHFPILPNVENSTDLEKVL